MQNLETQLNELDMLMSMFDPESEIVLDDPAVLADVRALVESHQNCRLVEPCGQIAFTMKLKTENQHSIEIMFRLPQTYPNSKPDVSLRCSLLSRRHHQQFNEDLHSFITELKPDDPVVFEIIQWIKDNCDKYIEQSINDCAENTKTTNVLATLHNEQTFSRLWIYSHHIYNKVKRKDILNFADELNLTGFSVPGKPGIICVEGQQRNAEDFWQRIRSMQWKKISLIHREDIPIEGASKNLEQLRTFQGFEEKHFDPRCGRGREVHMDLGLLFQFLQQNGFAEVFQMYFGMSGKETCQESDKNT